MKTSVCRETVHSAPAIDLIESLSLAVQVMETELWFCSEQSESRDRIVYVTLFDCHFYIATFAIINSQTIIDPGQKDKRSALHDSR